MRTTCQTIGRAPISTMGLGMSCVRSCRRVPRPPQRMTTGVSNSRGMMSTALDVPHVLDVRAVLGVLARAGGEPRVEDLGELGRARGAQREREHVGVVPPAGAVRGGGVGAQRRADALDLVGGDRGTGPRPAADDGLLG